MGQFIDAWSFITGSPLMHIEAFIQARMESTRLPGKIFKKVLGRPLLDFLIERISQSKEIDDIVILTTYKRDDDVIVSYCQDRNFPFFRGSEEDVLDRYYQAALDRELDAIVRITADCPLIDPEIIDQIVRTFKEANPKLDYVSNTLERTFPRGLDVEVFSFPVLQQTAMHALKLEEREHVTPYIHRHPELFRLKNIGHTPLLNFHRWTVDTSEDFVLIRLILEHLYPSHPQFRLHDILQLLDQHPSWIEINAHVEQKKI